MTKSSKVLTLVIGLLLFSPALFAMKKAIVLDSCPYPRMAGKVVMVQGTIKEIFDIDNFLDSKTALKLPVFINYMLVLPPKLLKGTVYYAKVNGFGYCFHESWLKMMPDDQKDDEEEAEKE